jgi:Transcriptional regulator, contains sigma factor-related N-terminal domain
MNTLSVKTQRLERVARLYYEQNKTQAEIAIIMGISRPLVSRMMQEARQLGIIEVKIHSFSQEDDVLLKQVKTAFGIKGGSFVPELQDVHMLNLSLAQATMQCIRQLGGGRLSIGWGNIVGNFVEFIEQDAPEQGVISSVCPMVGNSGVTIRNYHSNENVRIVAQHTKATPHYLHIPAFAETQQDLDLLRKTEHYKAMLKEWEQLDIALVNIGNYPSTPDFASVARYGNLLTKHKAVGQLIAYYYNEEGEIIQSESDCTIQIPIPLLEKCQNVIGICSASVGTKALAGALRTGIFSHIIARENLASQVLKSLPVGAKTPTLDSDEKD